VRPRGRGRRARNVAALIPVLLCTGALAAQADAGRCAPASGDLDTGAYVAGAPFAASKLDAYTSLIGRSPDVVMWYQDWADAGVREFSPKRADAVRSRGAVPMLTWDPWDRTRPDRNPFSLTAIVAGTHDTYIRRFGNAVADWGDEVWLRFAHEMNGDWYPWGDGVNGNTPASFVRAWRHIVDLFRAEGARNVRWVWSPNVAYTGGPPLGPLYPGDEYVDLVAMDGYNWGDEQWRPADEIFLETYAELCQLTSRPMVIAEIGSSEDGGDKARWIARAFAAIRSQFPAVKAVIWFNEDKERDWRVNSSAESLTAFRRAISDAAARP